MEERRKFKRFPTALSTKYVVVGINRRKDSRVTEISREGTRINLCTGDKIDISSDIRLEINVPTALTPVTALATLVWIEESHEETEFSFIAGCRLTKIKDEDKWILLDYAYDDWYAHEKKGE